MRGWANKLKGSFEPEADGRTVAARSISWNSKRCLRPMRKRSNLYLESIQNI